MLLQRSVEAFLHPAVPKSDTPQRLEVYLVPPPLWFFQMNPINSQLRLDTVMGSPTVFDELPSPADGLAVGKFLPHWAPLEQPTYRANMWCNAFQFPGILALNTSTSKVLMGTFQRCLCRSIPIKKFSLATNLSFCLLIATYLLV